jgi:D-alanyl-lipoteichoic acid acyltransferase DltB (MBOAT superfamily)
MHGAWVFGHKLYQDLARTTLPKGVVGFLRNNPAGHALCVLLTFHGVAVTWVFFGAPDLAAAIAYLRAMTGGAA